VRSALRPLIGEGADLPLDQAMGSASQTLSPVGQPARCGDVGHERRRLDELDRAGDRRLLVGAAGGEHPDRGGAH
jgi:hypothetical protein